MNKLERYLDNLKEDALKQVIRVLMSGTNTVDNANRREMIENQVEEFNKMYPKGGE